MWRRKNSTEHLARKISGQNNVKVRATHHTYTPSTAHLNTIPATIRISVTASEKAIYGHTVISNGVYICVYESDYYQFSNDNN